MRLPFVTQCLFITVTVLSLYCGLVHFWGSVRHAGLRDNELEQDPHLEAEAYFVKLVLGRTPWWAVWTIATSGFVETQVLPYLIFILVACTGGKYCEKVWSSRSYAYFVLVTLMGTTFVETVFWSWLATPPTPICGTNGLLAGIVVALRQMIPGHTIILFKNRIRLQIRWLPISFLLLVSVLQLLGLEDNVFAYYLGFVGGWYYLRYHQVVDGIGVGDASDAFSFANFFPHPVAIWIEPMLDKTYYLFSDRLPIVRKFTSEEIEEGNQRYAARLSGALLPSHKGKARFTNERRKMMLKAMDKGL